MTTRIADDAAVLPPVRKLGEIKHAADISDERLLAALGYGPDAKPVTAEALALVAEIKAARFTAADMAALVHLAWCWLIHRPSNAGKLEEEMCSGFHPPEVACTPLSDRWRRRLPAALARLQAAGKAAERITENGPTGGWHAVEDGYLLVTAATYTRCPLAEVWDVVHRPQENA